MPELPEVEVLARPRTSDGRVYPGSISGRPQELTPTDQGEAARPISRKPSTAGVLSNWISQLREVAMVCSTMGALLQPKEPSEAENACGSTIGQTSYVSVATPRSDASFNRLEALTSVQNVRSDKPSKATQMPFAPIKLQRQRCAPSQPVGNPPGIETKTHQRAEGPIHRAGVNGYGSTSQSPPATRHPSDRFMRAVPAPIHLRVSPRHPRGAMAELAKITTTSLISV